MHDTPKNTISFKLTARYVLFTDPITKIGGEKCSYHLPTYEAMKGVLKSIYWKPTIIWYVDKLRVMKSIRTQTKGTKTLNWTVSKATHDLSIYTFLHEVEYQVQAHFEWNMHRPELEKDRLDGKHFSIAQRSLKLGGRQDVFLGTRDCQGYVEPCDYGTGVGAYDGIDELGFGLMFHGFDYPDETGKNELQSRFWQPTMRHGEIVFDRPENCKIRRYVRPMVAKSFELEKTLRNANDEEVAL